MAQSDSGLLCPVMPTYHKQLQTCETLYTELRDHFMARQEFVMDRQSTFITSLPGIKRETASAPVNYYRQMMKSRRRPADDDDDAGSDSSADVDPSSGTLRYRRHMSADLLCHILKIRGKGDPSRDIASAAPSNRVRWCTNKSGAVSALHTIRNEWLQKGRGNRAATTSHTLQHRRDEYDTATVEQQRPRTESSKRVRVSAVDKVYMVQNWVENESAVSDEVFQ